MQILKGTKREITLMEWNEQLKKAEKKLSDSQECERRFGDGDSKQWVDEDEKKVAEIKQHIKEVTEYMDKHNIKQSTTPSRAANPGKEAGGHDNERN